LDAGAEWNNYASDIVSFCYLTFSEKDHADDMQTRTFPLNGKFTKESRAIYDIVLKMQKDTTAILKAGIDWDEAHLLAHKIAIDGLLSLGILKGDKDEILKARTSAAFFPHGLGHYLGMDTHDVGGNPNPKDPDTLFRYLRLRAKLPAGSVVTNEPGVSYHCRLFLYSTG
jgi:Xaa-Pro dipeptidase